MLKEKLAWGARELVPADAIAAWGARAIVSSQNFLDVPGDRYGFAGEAAPLIEKLRAVNPIRLAEDKLPLLSPGDDVIDLYEDDGFAAKGILRGGYFYLAAWLKG